MYLSSYARATAMIQSIVLEKSPVVSFKSAKRHRTERLGTLTCAFALDVNLVVKSYFRAQMKEQEIALEHVMQGIERLANRDISQLIAGSDTSDFPARYDNIRLAYNRALENF